MCIVVITQYQSIPEKQFFVWNIIGDTNIYRKTLAVTVFHLNTINVFCSFTTLLTH